MKARFKRFFSKDVLTVAAVACVVCTAIGLVTLVCVKGVEM